MGLEPETARLLVEIGQKAKSIEANGPKPVEFLDNERETHYWEGQTVIKQRVPPPTWNCQHYSLEGLVEFFARKTNEDNDDEVLDCPPSLWHNHSSVVALLGDEHRLERAHLSINTFAIFEAMKALKSGASFDQKGFVKWLRITLASYAPTGLLELVRSMNLTRTVGVDSRVGATKDTFGKSIEQEAIFGGEAILDSSGNPRNPLPETFDVICPVYERVLPPEFRAKFTVSLMLDLDESDKPKFRLDLVGDCLRAAIDEAQDVLHARIEELVAKLAPDTPVYYGSP